MVDILNTIRDLIVADALITFPCTIGYGVDAPDNLIYLRLTDGDNSKVHFATSTSQPGIYKPRFIVTVRSTDYESGYNIAEAIKSKFAVNKLSDYVGVFLEGDIYDAGKDEIGRTQFELTYKSLINM